VALRLTAISSAYTYAVQTGEFAANPVAHVRRPKPPHESPTLGLDRAQAQAVLATAADGHPRDLALVCLLMLNGPRVSEATGATLADLETVRGHRVLVVHGKGSKTRRAPLAPGRARPSNGTWAIAPPGRWWRATPART
jgi:integrase/recombinase XerD